MKNIRKSVFETNSSSSHSIHIDNETELFDTTLLPDHYGRIIFTGGQFGWGWERFHDALTKSNYASISSSGINKEYLEEAIRLQTGAKEFIYDLSGNYDNPNWSYIDHESYGKLSCLDSVEKVRNFIFNPNCWIVIGNDNEHSPFNIFDFPKVTKTGVKLINWKYEIVINNETTDAKFKRKPSKKELVNALETSLSNIYFDCNGKPNNRMSFSSKKHFFSIIDSQYFNKFNNKTGWIVFNEEGNAVMAYCVDLVEKDSMEKNDAIGKEKFHNLSYDDRNRLIKETYLEDKDKYRIEIPFEVKKIQKVN